MAASESARKDNVNRCFFIKKGNVVFGVLQHPEQNKTQNMLAFVNEAFFNNQLTP
jgi:hypothetical protein